MKLHFHPIGKRIIKSAVGVMLCYVVFLLRGRTGLPFYSMLAVLQCMQPYTDKTVTMAIQRSTGTLVGAFYGLIALLLEIYAFPCYDTPLGYLLNALMIVPVLYTPVTLGKKSAAYFSTVVYLSITVNHIADSNPFIFVLNRVLDTFIGIAIGIIVNNARLPHKKVKNKLFVADIDEMLSPMTEEMSAYSRVELNRILDDGANFTVVTMRTPASLMKPLGDIRLRLPAVVMNGAALYDIRENTYVKAYIISNNTCEKVRKMIHAAGMNCFTNALRGDRLMIYYDELANDAEKSIYESLKKSPYRLYVNLPVPPEDKVIYLMMIDKTEKIVDFYNKLNESEFGAHLKIITYPSNDYKGYAYIKIYNKNADRTRMVEFLMNEYNINEVEKVSAPAENKHGKNLNGIVKSLKKKFEPIWFLKSKS